MRKETDPGAQRSPAGGLSRKPALRAAAAVAVLAAGMAAQSGPGEPGPDSPGSAHATAPDSAVAADLQRQVNELRSKLLDERERRLRLREEAYGAVLVVLGVVIGIGGLWAYAKFRSIAAQAGIGATSARRYVLAPRGILHDAGPPDQPPADGPGPLPLLASKGFESPPGTAAGSGDVASPSLAAASRNGSVRGGGGALNGMASPRGPAVCVPDAADLQRREEVIADCTAAIRLDPRNPLLWLERGDARCGMERYEEAVADYDRAIRLDPDLVAAYLGRCRARSELGLHEEAIEDFDRVSCLDPDSAAAVVDR